MTILMNRMLGPAEGRGEVTNNIVLTMSLPESRPGPDNRLSVSEPLHDWRGRSTTTRSRRHLRSPSVKYRCANGTIISVATKLIPNYGSNSFELWEKMMNIVYSCRTLQECTKPRPPLGVNIVHCS